ncbi:hypothetical protein R1W01_04255 [Shimia sp. FJ5]|uniref:hypothetical protein n=1 Tax=uncultured Shimia sp. TaxID=573152 RepID=UPI00263189E7|nr:hypothetical protein [uncultured Shimia sp.]MDV4144028.1 hypothetical protein [Shimia sp. FJ5]
MATWTFVVEFEGGTYCSQFRAETLQDAISQYNTCDPSEQGAVPLDADATELTGLKNIFCTGGLAEDGAPVMVANIVKTEISE